MTLMRTRGVMRLTAGPVEIWLGPEPPKPGDKTERNPLDAKREHYELQLGRRFSDEELKNLP